MVLLFFVGSNARGESPRPPILYDITRLLEGDRSISLMGGEQMALPAEWSDSHRLWFEDLVPGANWKHAARYRIVDRAGRTVRTWSHNTPPAKLGITSPLQGSITSADPARFSLTDHGGKFRIKTPGKAYALFINGFAEQRHWNDFSFMYRTLTTVYGYSTENIYVADTIFRTKKPDLDGDGRWDIRYDSSINGVKSAIEDLAKQLTENDQLLIMVNDHGEIINGESTLVLYNGEVTASAFSKWFEKIPSSIIAVFGQCYSGGFVRPFIKDHKNRVAIAASSDIEISWARPDRVFNEFLYHWISAMSHQRPDGTPVSADHNQDGLVSAREAFAYAIREDRAPETPLMESFRNSGTDHDISLTPQK